MSDATKVTMWDNLAEAVSTHDGEPTGYEGLTKAMRHLSDGDVALLAAMLARVPYPAKHTHLLRAAAREGARRKAVVPDHPAPKQPKVFGVSAHYHAQQVRAIVRANSRKEAAQALSDALGHHYSVDWLANFGALTGNDAEVALATGRGEVWVTGDPHSTSPTYTRVAVGVPS